MILTRLERDVTADGARIRCTLEFADPEREPFELWFGVPAEYADDLDPTANPFVPVAALVAARLKERLRVDAPVSPRIVAGAERATALFADWWGYRALRIRAPRPADAGPRGPGAGVLFSRGVDTCAAVVRSRTGEIPERVTHLLSGYDIEWVFSEAVQRDMWAGHERAAAAWGLPLVRLESNAKDLLRGLIGWPRCFGAAYIGAALALGPALGAIVTGATQPMAGAQPRGSRFDLDPLWSTESTLVRQDAIELSRAERIAIVASDEVALRSLKVCWASRGAGNCGRCSKCLRTMTALAVAGVTNGRAPFDGELSVEAVRAAPVERSVGALRSIAASVPAKLDGLAVAWRDKAAEAERLARAHDRRRARAERRRRSRRLRRRLRRRARGTVRRIAGRA
jgi:hypothetical protein